MNNNDILRARRALAGVAVIAAALATAVPASAAPEPPDLEGARAGAAASVSVRVNVRGDTGGGTCDAGFLTPAHGQPGGQACPGYGQANGRACGRPGDTVVWRFIGGTDAARAELTFLDGVDTVCEAYTPPGPGDASCTLKALPDGVGERAFKYGLRYRFDDGTSCSVDPYIITRRI